MVLFRWWRNVELEGIFHRNAICLLSETHFPLQVDSSVLFVCLVCRARIDLGLLVDGTNNRYRFKKILKVVNQLIRYFDISRVYTRIGVIAYSSSSIPYFNFKRFARKYDVLGAVRKISFPQGVSYTGRALRFAGRYLFPGTRRTYARSKVLVVFTGAQSKDSVARPAQMLKRSGVEIFAVGTGSWSSRSYLESIAYDRYHVFNTASRLGLKTVLDRLVAKICVATPIGKPTTASTCAHCQNSLNGYPMLVCDKFNSGCHNQCCILHFVCLILSMVA